MKNENFIYIEVLRPLGEFEVGQRIRVEADSEGIPKERYWRSRLKDAPIDGCCKVVKEKRESQNKTSKK